MANTAAYWLLLHRPAASQMTPHGPWPVRACFAFRLDRQTRVLQRAQNAVADGLQHTLRRVSNIGHSNGLQTARVPCYQTCFCALQRTQNDFR
eukprot:4343801-Pleurochrysis_carterae.AAC.8